MQPTPRIVLIFVEHVAVRRLTRQPALEQRAGELLDEQRHTICVRKDLLHDCVGQRLVLGDAGNDAGAVATAKAAQGESLLGKLLKLPDETMVYPAHDKGDTVSTIGEEKLCNPSLQVKSAYEYVDLMSKLNLPNPKMMDVDVPANMRVGLAQEEIAKKGYYDCGTKRTPKSFWLRLATEHVILRSG